MPPLVSVIIPVFNRLCFLHAAIESVLAQTYRSYEIVVVDDGSTVDVSSHLHKFRGDLTLLRKENGGLASARNFGVKSATGEFLAFLDDDDLFCPEKLERQVAILDNNPSIGMVYSREYVINQVGGLIGDSVQNGVIAPLPSGSIAKDYFMNSFIGVMTTLVPRKVFEEMNGFDEKLYFNEDDDLWFRIMLQYPVIYDDYVSGIRRIHDSNMSKDRNSMVYYQLECIEKYINIFPDFMIEIENNALSRAKSIFGGYLCAKLKKLSLPSLNVIKKYMVVRNKLVNLKQS